MTALAEALPRLPRRRADLIVRPLGGNGQYVAKHASRGDFFHLGEQEHFLLDQLDSNRSPAQVCQAFADHFSEPLSEEELDQFIGMAREQGLVEVDNDPSPVAQPAKPKQSLLYWRKRIFDPDRLFTWLEPKIRCFWTPSFLILSAASIVIAVGITWGNRHQLGSSFTSALRWETLIVSWITLLLITTLHEFAHGLTCKRFGGEVREIGFLLLLFMPCFYCNVSDAWLFKERSRRLLVTFAGGYFELFLWAIAVFVWRFTMPDTLPHYVAFIVMMLCGIETLFNFNPLIKLDGYYMLSDWLELPNLQKRSSDYLKQHARWLLWGAERPLREPRGVVLLMYGLTSLLYCLAFIALMGWGLIQFLGTSWGPIGLLLAAAFTVVPLRGLLSGFGAGEIITMLTTRCRQTLIWLCVAGALMSLLFVPIQDRASGAFQLRSAVRVELRAPVAGFVKEVLAEESDLVAPGSLIVRLEVPDLESRRQQKAAEIRESRARLRLLQAGARPEELAEAQRRIERAIELRDLARSELVRMQTVLDEELIQLDQQIAQCTAELEAATAAKQRAQTLLEKSALGLAEHEEAIRRMRVCTAQLEQAQAQRRGRAAAGTRDAETELARRDNELAEAQARLILLQAGARPEEIDAEEARLARLNEEAGYLDQLQERLLVRSSIDGWIVTPRLREKIGQFVNEGDLLCAIEQPQSLEVLIALAEQEAARVQPGHHVRVKARALPFHGFAAAVDRIAPVAATGETQSTVLITCRLIESDGALRSGMTGHAYIYTGRRPAGLIAIHRLFRFIRTEFWW